MKIELYIGKYVYLLQKYLIAITLFLEISDHESEINCKCYILLNGMIP